MRPLDPTAWGVLAGGVLLIALVLWYFFGEREAVRAAPAAEGAPKGAPTAGAGPRSGADRERASAS